MALPTITATGDFTGPTLSNATDVAGIINTSVSVGSGNGTLQINFGYAYSVPPIVVITPRNSVAASTKNNYYVSSANTSSFIITAFNNSTDSISLYYHVFETQ